VRPEGDSLRLVTRMSCSVAAWVLNLHWAGVLHFFGVTPLGSAGFSGRGYYDLRHDCISELATAAIG
jgi:hypothetical protein